MTKRVLTAASLRPQSGVVRSDLQMSAKSLQGGVHAYPVLGAKRLGLAVFDKLVGPTNPYDWSSQTLIIQCFEHRTSESAT